MKRTAAGIVEKSKQRQIINVKEINCQNSNPLKVIVT